MKQHADNVKLTCLCEIKHNYASNSPQASEDITVHKLSLILFNFNAAWQKIRTLAYSDQNYLIKISFRNSEIAPFSKIQILSVRNIMWKILIHKKPLVILWSLLTSQEQKVHSGTCNCAIVPLLWSTLFKAFHLFSNKGKQTFFSHFAWVLN